MDFTKEALKTVSANGYTITKPRRLVLEILEKSKKPVSAYDIKRLLGKKNFLSAITIYRILEFFLSLNIIHRVFAENGYVKCSNLGSKGCHHVLICKKCHEVHEFITSDHMSHTLKNIKNIPFAVDEHVFELLGLCIGCGGVSKKENKRTEKCENSQLSLEL